MKKLIALPLATIAALVLLASLPILPTGCKSVTTVGTNGVTNVVRTLDPAKVQAVADAVQPILSSVVSRVMKNSPQHAPEIATYARAFGHVFCQMETNNDFSVDYLVNAANQATANLQTNVDQNIIDGKNALIAIYKICASDQLTWQLPNNAWLQAVADTMCNSINQALLDNNQAGCK